MLLPAKAAELFPDSHHSWIRRPFINLDGQAEVNDALPSQIDDIYQQNRFTPSFQRFLAFHPLDVLNINNIVETLAETKGGEKSQNPSNGIGCMYEFWSGVIQIMSKNLED